MPDPGGTGTSEENAVRNDSLDIVAANEIEDVNSFGKCPTCLGLNRTPTLHSDHRRTSADSTDKDAVADGSDGKVDGASSSSSSELAKEPDNYDPIERQLSLDELGEERAEVIGGVTAAGGVAQTVFAASSNAGPSSPDLEGKRKADDAEDSPPKKIQRSATSNEADHNAAEQWARYWANRPVKIFRDPLQPPGTSSGTGSCMRTLHEVHLNGIEYPPWDVPMDMDIEPERATGLLQAPKSLYVPTGTICHEGDRLTSSLDELYISDPEGVGLEGVAGDILISLPAEANT